MLDFRTERWTWTLDAGYGRWTGTLDTGNRTQDPRLGHWTLDTRRWTLHAGLELHAGLDAER